jgi:hypothetical protein
VPSVAWLPGRSTISLYIYSSQSQAIHYKVCASKGGEALRLGPLMVSGGRSRRVEAQVYESVRARLTACFLCLLFVGISLDGLPDPPAVKPRGNLSSLLPLPHSRVPLATSNHVREYLVHFQPNSVSFAQNFQDEEPPIDLIVVSQAADASPPFFLMTTSLRRRRTSEDP